MLYYFGSKEGLLRETVAERDRASAPHAGDVGTLSSLRDIGKHNVETAALVRLYVVLGAESLDPDDPLHGFFVERYETARALTRELLQREHDEGRIRPDSDIDQLAREIIAVIMGLEMQWLADPERVDLETSIRDYIDRLIGTSRRRDARPRPTPPRPIAGHTVPASDGLSASRGRRAARPELLRRRGLGPVHCPRLPPPQDRR